ncbi:hypothetical protein B0H11DRAFT_2271702 [Mycena galericulata]|nr:hypothetical protein B0H11DRAFT_2271702 [Mycena galericulata]
MASKPLPSILSLPDELLVEIAGQENYDPTGPTLHCEFDLAWILSRVSRRFRLAIISAPSLWTIVQAETTREGSVEISKLYLERSRACKMWVTLRDFSQLEEENHLHINDLIPHIHRIWRLDIESERVESMFIQFSDIAAPFLEHLEIKGSDRFEEVAVNVFSLGAPRLTFLKLAYLSPLEPVPKWAVSLTHLDLRVCPDLQLNNIFTVMITQCTSLIHLCIDSWANLSTAGELGINIPSLKSLHLEFVDSEDMLETIGLFDTPALTDLVCKGAHGDEISVLFDPTSLPLSSFPALTSLSFVNSGCGYACESDSHFRAIFRTISSPPLRLFPAPNFATVGTSGDSYTVFCNVREVYSTLQQIVRSKHERQQTLPKLRLPSDTFYQGDWAENGVDVELFDPMQLLEALD